MRIQSYQYVHCSCKDKIWGLQQNGNHLQGFIQALLLTLVFHEELSFMAVGQDPMYVSMLALAPGG